MGADSSKPENGASYSESQKAAWPDGDARHRERGGKAALELNLTAHDFSLVGTDGELTVVGGQWGVEVEGAAITISLA